MSVTFKTYSMQMLAEIARLTPEPIDYLTINEDEPGTIVYYRASNDVTGDTYSTRIVGNTVDAALASLLIEIKDIKA